MIPLKAFPAGANDASFNVRVVLHDATWDEYELLHERMAAIGFFREVVGDSGLRYKLPDAEYHGFSRLPYERLRDVIQYTADGVKPPAIVVVSEVVRMAWTLPIAG